MLWNVSFVFIMIMRMASWTECYNPFPRGSLAWGYFTPPLLHRVPQQTPMEDMVELTNDLAVAILQDHSFSRGNFAFSPYGVASVLVVLYEGARGESARQIHRAIGFPSDKDVIRIGFRDIHRHLRSYFSHEGYLSGISLNREDSSLKPEYKKILRFYGYDVETSQGTEEEGGASKTTVSGTASESATAATEVVTESAEGIKRTTGTEENVVVDRTTTDFSQTGITNGKYPESQTTAEHNCSLINKGKQEGCGSVTVTTTEKQSEDREMLLGSTEPPVTEPKITETTIVGEITDLSLDNGMLIPQPEDTEAMTTLKSTVLPVTETTTSLYSTPTETTLTTLGVTSTPHAETTDANSDKADKKKAGNWISSKNEIKMTKNTTKEEDQRVENIRNMFNKKSLHWLTENPRKSSSRKTRTITDYLKVPHSPQLSLQLQNGMYDTHIARNADLYRSLPRLLFLVDGAIDTPVPMMTYSSVFSYAYIPRLHSKAMEFPLDDNRYKLLILLPVERRGLRQLIYDLSGIPLNNVLKALQPQRVKVMVPTFMVEGFVILTSSLQKLGIWDVFDPRKANLSGMSMDPELYVRNVEQSVTVVIRNYVEILDIQTRTMAARHMEQEFEATHPFLYFVMDTATNVALMAGQILDPLNSRIY